MTTTLQTIHDVSVLMCAPEGEAIARESDALDLIGNAGYQGATWVVVPVERFDGAFFELRTRVAGDIIQKFVQYGVGLAVIGDISRYTTPVHPCGTSSVNATATVRRGSWPMSTSCGSD